MKIIAKRAFQFIDGEIVPDIKTNELKRVIKAEFKVKPSVRPQDAPDWIKNDALFDLAVADGNLKVVA
jgi:hypothetical protein